MLRDDDLMVLVGIPGIQSLTDEAQTQHDLHFSSWQDIIPQKYQMGFVRDGILIHITPHPGHGPDHTNGLKAGEIRQSKDAMEVSTNRQALCNWDRPLSFIRLELSPGYLQRADLPIATSAQLPSLSVFHAYDEKIRQMSAWLLEEENTSYNGGKLYLDSLANILVLHILRHYSDTWRKSQASRLPHLAPLEVTRAIEYMQAHLSQDISLAVLSQIVHISPSQLGRLFKRSTNLTPHQYLILLRLAHARELLHSGMLPISEIASQSGFVDQSHLNRHFKRVYGLTPKTILNGR